MADEVKNRVADVMSREASSLSGDRQLLAEIRFNSVANGQHLWARYTPKENWHFLSDADDDSVLSLRSEAVKQIRLVVPSPMQTNCWETVFYLAGLAECEGGQGKLPNAFVRQQENAGKLRRVNSIDDADIVANGCGLNPNGIVHAALRVEYELVRGYLRNLTQVKELCASQLGLTMMTEIAPKYAGHVLIERFGASLSCDTSKKFGNGSPLSFAIEFGELRDYPMFYALLQN